MQGGWGPPGDWSGDGRHLPAAAHPFPPPALLSAPRPASSMLTTEQHERAERNRLAALRRQDERRAGSQAGSQAPTLASSGYAAAAAAAAEADPASSRPPSALRGLFTRPQSAAGSYDSQQLVQQQQVQQTGPWQEEQQQQHPQARPQQQWQPPQRSAPAFHPPPTARQQPYGLPHMHSAAANPASCGASIFSSGPDYPARLPSAAGGAAPPSRPGSAGSLYSITSQRQQQQQQMVQQPPPRQGFAFTVPSGLAGGIRSAAAPSQEQGSEAGASFAVRKHPRAITPQAPAATASTWQQQQGPPRLPPPQQQQRQPAQQWKPHGGVSVAPTMPPGRSGSAAGASGAQRAGGGSSTGCGRGRSRFGGSAGSKAGNITYSFDPTPQPQKPTTQVTLQQAISRHAKAKAEQQEEQQAQQQQQQAPFSAAAAVAGEPRPLAVPEQQPYTAERQPVVGGVSGPAGSTPAYRRLNNSQQYGPAGSLAHPLPPLPPLPPAPVVSGSAALGSAPPQQQPRFASQAHSHQPAATAGQQAAAAVPTLSSASGLRRPPMPAPPGRPTYKEAPAVSAAAGTWWPSPAATPANAAGQCGLEARRAKLQRLLCAEADPFANAASAGRRWEWLKDPQDAQGRPPAHPNHDPTTLHIPPAAWQRDLKGAAAQYWRIKSQGLAHTVLFFQEGNFYHLKDRDADIGMRVGLQPMGGARGSAANMWCVGCNVSAFNEWAAKVLSLGYTVARVDEDKRGQREPGSTLVKRTLRCVYSPGTLLEGVMLDACGAQPLVTVFEGRSLCYGAAIVDVQTATITFASWQEADTQRSMLRALLLTADPAEVGFARGQLSADTKRLLHRLDPVGGGGGRAVALTHIPHLLPADPDSDDTAAADILLEHTADMFLAQRGKPAAFAAARQQLTPHATAALQLAIQHLMVTQTAQAVLPAVTLRPLDGPVGGARSSGHMLLDACALRSLELLSNSEGKVEGSLLHFLDRAATPAGRRKVRHFIANPLFRVGDIEERLATAELFMAHPQAAHNFQSGLHHAPDCERLLAKAAAVLAGVVDKVAAAEEAEEEAAQAPPPPQQEQQGWGAGSRWGMPAAQPRQWGVPARQQAVPAESQQQGAAGQVAHLASVLDLSQGAFMPVVQLFEGTGMMLQALHNLRCAIAAQRGGTQDALLPPPLQRAVLRGEVVAGALQLLLQVFDAERFDDGCADIALEPGLCVEYDAARASLEQLQAAAGQTLDSIRQQLAAAGHGAAVLRRVKLAEYRGEQLLEVPAAVRRDLEALTAASGSAAVLVKEASTIAKYRLPGLAATLEAIEEARDAAKLCVLRFLAESAQLFLDSYDSFRELFNALSTLDVLAGFAAATSPEAAPPGCAFCRPTFAAGAGAGAGAGDGSSGTGSRHSAPPLRLQGLWNPALLASRAVDGINGGIQANDLALGGPGVPGMLLLTGPNTGGKSTLLRATCIAAVMAQIGCYVPAACAELAPVDRVFTRIGAQDRICRGESTFAVEMLETSSLLHHSTAASLVVLDELGRGTATHEGHAIAYGVALHLAQTKRCRSLFATHYHGLTQEPGLAALVQRGHMEAAVDPRRGLLPSYRLAPGPAPMGSCGVAVAAACQLPAGVVARAAEVAQRAERAGRPEEHPADGQPAAPGSPGRQPLATLNAGRQPGLPPPTKRPRLEQAAAMADDLLAAEQQEALAAVKEATLAALAGAPGAAAQLANLQAAVRAALAAGQL